MAQLRFRDSLVIPSDIQPAHGSEFRLSESSANTKPARCCRASVNRLAVAWGSVVGLALLAHGTAPKAEAQLGEPTHQQILQAISNLQTSINTLQTTVANQESTLNGQISALQSALSGVQAGVSSLQSSLSTVQTKVDNLQTSLTTVQDTVNALPTDPRKKYYLTNTTVQGNSAVSASAAGFHMASFWEIFNTSVLKYDTGLGRVAADSGAGPVAGVVTPDTTDGWVRTGSPVETVNEAGTGNCNAWTSASAADHGSIVELSPLWSISGGVQWVAPWVASTPTCDQHFSVWCVED